MEEEEEEEGRWKRRWKVGGRDAKSCLVYNGVKYLVGFTLYVVAI